MHGSNAGQRMRGIWPWQWGCACAPGAAAGDGVAAEVWATGGKRSRWQPAARSASVQRSGCRSDLSPRPLGVGCRLRVPVWSAGAAGAAVRAQRTRRRGPRARRRAPPRPAVAPSCPDTPPELPWGVVQVAGAAARRGSRVRLARGCRAELRLRRRPPALRGLSGGSCPRRSSAAPTRCPATLAASPTPPPLPSPGPRSPRGLPGSPTHP